MNQSPALEAINLSKTYTSGERQLTVLNDVSFSIDHGTSCAIVGPSGSGKTTLLGLCAGLDHVSAGSVYLDGIALAGLNEDQRARLRNERVGFVFQNFQLVPALSALENVMIPLELRGEKDARQRAVHWLERVGLDDRLGHYPAQLSGGEQQRVAVARAFINEPRVLFADEPTGNLDDETSEQVQQLLFSLNREASTTLVLVTHDLELAQRTQRIIRLKGGAIIEDVELHAVTPPTADARPRNE